VGFLYFFIDFNWWSRNINLALKSNELLTKGDTVIYIIADDLTGANDTGVQFSKQGYNTQVVIMSETGESQTLPSKDTDVFVIDTETRETDAATARERIKRILERLSVHAEDIVYKKVDSTLRGNIGAELDECMNALEKDICIFAPSFPSNKRISVEGYLIVQDQLLGLSEYYSGNLGPEEASFIPALLRPHTNFPIARIDLEEVIKGSGAILEKLQKLYQTGQKIIVVDAINGEQLQNILKSSFKFEGSVLYSGSAGLANALSEIYGAKRHSRINADQSREPVLIVNGSRRTINQRQRDYLKTKIDFVEISIDVDKIFTEKKKYLGQYVTDSILAVQESCHIVIYPEPLYLDKQVSENMLLKYELDFREMELAIRDFLGELVANIMGNTPVANMILTGGDTAIGVCSALQIYSLNIVDELLPGIPLSVGRFKGGIDLNIITKAGGFGEEDTLHVLIEKLTQLGEKYEKDIEIVNRH